jgi:serine/threonine-protein kinase RsbW
VGAPEASPPLLLNFSFPADPEEVRVVLGRVNAGLAALGAIPDAMGRVELVLAEVLNNIVEHAYADLRGEIALQLALCGQALRCRVADGGRPMPGGQLPAGRLPQDKAAELPEGGFGWHLIRTLAHDLRYARTGGQNVLTFHIPLFATDA